MLYLDILPTGDRRERRRGQQRHALRAERRNGRRPAERLLHHLRRPAGSWLITSCRAPNREGWRHELWHALRPAPQISQTSAMSRASPHPYELTDRLVHHAALAVQADVLQPVPADRGGRHVGGGAHVGRLEVAHRRHRGQGPALLRTGVRLSSQRASPVKARVAATTLSLGMGLVRICPETVLKDVNPASGRLPSRLCSRPKHASCHTAPPPL